MLGTEERLAVAAQHSAFLIKANMNACIKREQPPGGSLMTNYSNHSTFTVD